MADHALKDWTGGAPKWAAVVVLGAASVLGLGWAIGRDGSVWGRVKRDGVAAASVTTSAPARAAPAATPTIVETKQAPTGPAAASVRKLININTAGQAELELLPGIGPALAKRIMDYRASKGPFKRVEDLDAVKGIGPRTIERVRKMVSVE